jgi:hypothetical protein
MLVNMVSETWRTGKEEKDLSYLGVFWVKMPQKSRPETSVGNNQSMLWRIQKSEDLFYTAAEARNDERNLIVYSKPEVKEAMKETCDMIQNVDSNKKFGDDIHTIYSHRLFS